MSSLFDSEREAAWDLRCEFSFYFFSLVFSADKQRFFSFFINFDFNIYFLGIQIFVSCHQTEPLSYSFWLFVSSAFVWETEKRRIKI